MNNLTEIPHVKIYAMLLVMLDSRKDLVNQWWNTPNNNFDMQCPRDVPSSVVLDYLISIYRQH